MKTVYLQALLHLGLAFLAFGQAPDTPEVVLRKLVQKHKAPELPEIVLGDVVWYQLFVIPEVVTDDLYPVIMTVEIKFDSTFRATMGLLSTHIKRGNETTLIGKKDLSAKESEGILRAIGQNEVFELPMNYKVARYEFFPHFGGMRYIFVRKDQSGIKLVGRQDWSSEPLMKAAKKFTDLALPFLQKVKN